MTVHDVAIVGGGPAGLFCALALDAVGATVALIAPPPAPDRLLRTTALLGGSVTALERLGVWARIADQAAPLRVMRLVDATDRLIRAPLFEGRAQEIDRDAFGFNIANEALVGALIARLSDGGVTQIAAPATRVAIEAGQARVAAGEVEVVARLVVGAEGRRSLVRKAAGIGLDETRYPQTAITAVLDHSRPHEDVSTEFHTKDGPCTLVPMPGDRSSLVWSVKPREADRLLALDEAAFARAAETRVSSILGQFRLAGARGRFDLSLATPRAFGAPRACLIGEAAHVIPPIGAQGLNLGLRDGAVLADLVEAALGRGEDPGGPWVTQDYDAARRPDILGRSAAVHALNRTLIAGFGPFDALRWLGLSSLVALGPVRRAFMREGMEPGALPRLMRA